LFVAFFYLIKLLGLGLKQVMDITLTAWFDRVVGGLFGVIKGVFFSSLILIGISSYLSGSNKYLKDSFTYPFLSKSSKAILLFIRDYDLRSYFIPKEPAIMQPFFGKWSDGGEKSEVTKIPESEDEPYSENGPFKNDDTLKERRIFL